MKYSTSGFSANFRILLPKWRASIARTKKRSNRPTPTALNIRQRRACRPDAAITNTMKAKEAARGQQGREPTTHVFRALANLLHAMRVDHLLETGFSDFRLTISVKSCRVSIRASTSASNTRTAPAFRRSTEPGAGRYPEAGTGRMNRAVPSPLAQKLPFARKPGYLLQHVMHGLDPLLPRIKRFVL
jgi:hypothetical protein